MARTESGSSQIGAALLSIPGGSTPGDTESAASDDEDSSHKFGGVRVSRYSRTAKALAKLPTKQQRKMRVWRVINGPIERDDYVGRSINAFVQANVLGFIVLVIVSTDDRIYHPNKASMNAIGLVFATVITLEYFLNMWSVVANEEYSRGSATAARCRWALKFYPMVDVIVILAFWATELLQGLGLNHSVGEKVTGGMQTLRLIRLLRIFELFEGHRVKKAFSLLFRVLKDKGEDIAASLILMFVSLVFIAT